MRVIPWPLLPRVALARLVRLLIGCVCLRAITWPPAVLGAVDEPNLDEMLARIRAALGTESLEKHPAGILLEGRSRKGAEERRYSLQFTPGGKFLRRIEGNLTEVVIFDGTTAWGADWSRIPRRLEMFDLEVNQMILWVQTGRWLAPDSPLACELVPGQGGDDRIRLKLRFKHGIMEAELAVDRATYLPSLLKLQKQLIEEIWEYRDYRPVLGFKVPHTVVRNFGGLVETTQVETVREAPAGASDPYRFPAKMPADGTHFDVTVPARVPLERTPSGHLLVRPKVDGRDVGWFVLDTGTGAGMAIHPKTANALKLPTVGEFMGIGAGKAFACPLRRSASFALGPITLSQTVFIQASQESWDLINKGFGREVAGTCGYDLFSRAIVELDVKRNLLMLHDPQAYQLTSGRWESLALNHKVPCVRCRFEGGREGLFQLDTGAANGDTQLVVFHAPAVERLKLLEGRKASPIKVGGVGGIVEARMGKLDDFEVGGHRFTSVTGLFMLGHEGALADPYTIGTFGGGLLTPFNIVFDYPHRRIAFLETPADSP
jgi:hypothetical protein